MAQQDSKIPRTSFYFLDPLLTVGPLSIPDGTTSIRLQIEDGKNYLKRMQGERHEKPMTCLIQVQGKGTYVFES